MPVDNFEDNRRSERKPVRGRPFEKGNGGRRPGSKNRTTVVAEALLEGEEVFLVSKAIELAKAGDTQMLKFLLDRILLFGQPNIDEPLSQAWARALRHCEIDNNDQDAAAQELYPIISGTSSRFTEIFRTAPVWLLQFTGMALDARLLKFELPNISKKLKWGSSGFKDSQRWPLLPVGTISAGDRIPDSDMRLLIMIFYMITEPFPNLEDRVQQRARNRSPEGTDELELLDFLVKSSVKPDSEWSDYEKRRVRQLCHRLTRSKA